MKKTIFVVIVILCVGVIALVSCGPTTMLGSEAVTATQSTWNLAENKTAIDTVSIKNFDIAGLMTLRNADIEIKRVFTGDSLVADVKISAIDLALGTNTASLIKKLETLLTENGIDLEAMISAANNLTASLTANFDTDTWIISKLSFATVGLGAVLGEFLTLDDDEYTINKENIIIAKDDTVAKLVVPFATGHSSTLFGPAVGVNAGEPDVAAKLVLTFITPIIEALLGLVPDNIAITEILESVLGHTDINTILTNTLILSNATYSSTLDGEFINSQTYTSGVVFNIESTQVSRLWNDFLKDSIGDKLETTAIIAIPIVLIMLEKNVPLLTIEEFEVVSTYEIL